MRGTTRSVHEVSYHQSLASFIGHDLIYNAFPSKYSFQYLYIFDESIGDNISSNLRYCDDLSGFHKLEFGSFLAILMGELSSTVQFLI